VDPLELWIPTLQLGLGLCEAPNRSGTLIWQLLYTKPYAEEQAELNLRKQGFATLLPRVREGPGLAPLFPRYIFTGHRPGQPTSCLRSTYGVQDIVRFGEQPAQVPPGIIDEIRSRMNGRHVVRLADEPRRDPLFAKTQGERVRALERLVAAGFRGKVVS
jgi:Transcription termination factor nusG